LRITVAPVGFSFFDGDWTTPAASALNTRQTQLLAQKKVLTNNDGLCILTKTPVII
jgi:hypothetical protein